MEEEEKGRGEEEEGGEEEENGKEEEERVEEDSREGRRRREGRGGSCTHTCQVPWYRTHMLSAYAYISTGRK